MMNHDQSLLEVGALMHFYRQHVITLHQHVRRNGDICEHTFPELAFVEAMRCRPDRSSRHADAFEFPAIDVEDRARPSIWFEGNPPSRWRETFRESEMRCGIKIGDVNPL